MAGRHFHSITDQVVNHLRNGMVEGKWIGVLPGRDLLAEELGCSHWTVEEAMQRLAGEGLLVSQGPGKRRRIALPPEGLTPRALRVKILLYEASDRKTDYLVELVHRLQEAGHEVAFAEKTMRDLGMQVKRIARFVGNTDTQAWIVVAGSREILEWFESQPVPIFALFGRFRPLGIAGASPQKMSAYSEVIDRLVAHGHRRIVRIAREEQRKPTPGFINNFILEKLESHGIRLGNYNLPDWDDHPKGLHKLLDSLFKHTAPTALLVDEPAVFIATRDHLARIGFIAPQDVSLVCGDPNPAFDWCLPVVTHITWNSLSLINRVTRWANGVGRGKNDRRKTFTAAHLVPGGTIGPLPKHLSHK